MKSLLCAIVLTVLTTVAGVANAGTVTVWSSVGGGCVPTEVGSSYPNYSTSGGNISSISGTNLSLVCPVTNLADTYALGISCSSYSLVVRTKGSSSSYGKIYPYVIAMSGTDGSETVIANSAGAGITTSTFNISTAYTINMSVAGYWYVQVYLDGAYSSGHPTVQTLYAAEIDCAY